MTVQCPILACTVLVRLQLLVSLVQFFFGSGVTIRANSRLALFERHSVDVARTFLGEPFLGSF